MSKIELSKPVQDAMVQSLSRYLKREHDVEIEGFDAVFLLDFITEHLGPHYYNQGLYDAQAVMRSKFELVEEAIAEIEKPVKLR
jgi:uncharacterized protein (DUF2164 family)